MLIFVEVFTISSRQLFVHPFCTAWINALSDRKMALVATLKELKTTTARKLPIEVQIMGDESAPVWEPFTEHIKPAASAARQFKPFDKHCVGARDKQNNYVLLTAVGAKAIPNCKKHFKSGQQYRITGYKVRDEQERYYAPPLAFSIDCSNASFEKADLGVFPAWKPKDNIASLMTRKTPNRVDLAGKIIVNTYNAEKKRREVTLVDASAHRPELMLFETSCQENKERQVDEKQNAYASFQVGDTVCFTDMSLKINNGEISAVWSNDASQCGILTKIIMEAPNKVEETRTVLVPLTRKRYDDTAAKNFTCSEVSYVTNNGAEAASQKQDGIVVEVTNAYVTVVNDPMETVELKQNASQSSTLRVHMRIADRTGSFAAIGWERAALKIYGGEQEAPALSEIQNLVDRGWSPTFITTYDFRVKIDFNTSPGNEDIAKRGEATIVAVRGAKDRVVHRSSYLFSDGAVLPTSLSAFIFDSVYEQATVNHQGRTWPLANAVFVEMIVTGASKATIEQFESFLRVTNYCKDVQRLSEEPERKLVKRSSSEPSPLQASAVCVASQILSYEIAEGFMYHVMGSDIYYDSDTKAFCMTIVKSERINPEETDTFRARFHNASVNNADPAMQTQVQKAMERPATVYAVLDDMCPECGPWES